MRLGHLDYEVFGLILLDKRHRVIECVDLFRGTIDGASVHPREIVKIALQKVPLRASCITIIRRCRGPEPSRRAAENQMVAAPLGLDPKLPKAAGSRPSAQGPDGSQRGTSS